MSWHGELLVALRSGPKFIRMAKAQGGAPRAEACNLVSDEWQQLMFPFLAHKPLIFLGPEMWFVTT
jgi:hypothetical protein